MIASMTGFGRGEAEGGESRTTVEIRSVNGRFSEISVRLPRQFVDLEQKIKEGVGKSISRGKISVSVSWESKVESPVRLNVDVLRAYREVLSKVKDELGVEGRVDLSVLLGMPDVFKQEEEKLDRESAWSLMQKACDMALSEHSQMRKREGEELSVDFRKRIDILENLRERIEELAALKVEATRERLKEKIQRLLEDTQIDEMRLYMEVAVLAEKSDVTEECVRFHSHNSQFLATLDNGGPVGRRLNFLLQEIGREINTIGAKASDADISHLVVDIKEEVERLREQVQNVE